MVHATSLQRPLCASLAKKTPDPLGERRGVSPPVWAGMLAVALAAFGCGDKTKTSLSPSEAASDSGQLIERARQAERSGATELDLSDLAVRDGDMAIVAGTLPGLKILILGENRVGDIGVSFLAGCDSLEHLVLGDARITDIGLASLVRLKRLRHLNAAGTFISDDGLSRLAELPALKQLRIGGDAITSAGVAHLKQLKQLEWLILSGTQIDDDALDDFRQMTHLDSLYLFCPRISEEGLSQLHDDLRGKVHMHY